MARAHHRPRPSACQRGVATIAVALALLLGMTLVAFFTHRNLVLEQRSAIHHDRFARAFELAEGGLAWAGTRLNDPQRLDASPSCVPSVAGTHSFVERMVAMSAAGLAPLGGRPGCHVAPDGAVSCSCDMPPGTAAAPSAHARFALQLRRAAGADPWTLEVISRACTQAGEPCDATAAGSATPDATSTVRVSYRMRPVFAQAPGAAVLVAGDVAIGGGARVVNADAASRGLTIVAGGRIATAADVRLASLPGTPAEASIVDTDDTLARLGADTDALPRALLGDSLDGHRRSPLTWTVTAAPCDGRPRCTPCASPSECGGALAQAHARGFTQLWLDAPATLAGPSLGSERAPVVVVTTAPLTLDGDIVVRGLLVGVPGAGAAWRLVATGHARVHGAVASGGDLRVDGGSIDIVHDAALFAPGRIRGEFVRVPGSWTDRPDEP